MAKVAQKYQSKLKNIKENVEEAYAYFHDNYDRFHSTRKFIYESNLGVQDRSTLNDLNKPVVEANCLDAYISRQQGEFSKQTPSFDVHEKADIPGILPTTVEFLNGYLEAIKQEAEKDSFSIEVHKEQMSGGFSVMKVSTEWSTPLSFDQDIILGKSYDSTMVGFDPMARLPHKGDGAYCFELYPMERTAFENMYSNVNTKQFSYTRTIGGFSWSYTTGRKDIVLICDYYEKKKKKIRVHNLAFTPQTNNPKLNKMDVTDDEQKQISLWYEENESIAQQPIIIHSRTSEITIICFYRFIENEVLEYRETDFSYLPLVFVDGNSALISDPSIGANRGMHQFTKPYIFNAIDAQKVKNLAFQTIANEIENMYTSKFMIAKEAIPENYVDSWTNPQKMGVLVYNGMKVDGTQLPIPQAVQRVPMPPEVTMTFQGMDSTIQAILGNFDPMYSELTNSQVSGRAIVESATQNNAAAMPYMNNYLAALTRAGQIIVDLIPKIHMKPRSLPITMKDGRKSYVQVNNKNSKTPIMLNYKPSDLKVNIKAGMNYEIQKNQSLNMLMQMAEALPGLAQIINGPGLGIVVDNLNIRGTDQLKMLVQKAQEQQKQNQGQQGPNPAQLETMKIQSQQKLQQAKIESEQQIERERIAQDTVKNAQNYHIDLEKNKLTQQQLNIDKARVIESARTSLANAHVQNEKMKSENIHKAAELTLKSNDQEHQHANDILDHMKDMTQMAVDSNQPTGETHET